MYRDADHDRRSIQRTFVLDLKIFFPSSQMMMSFKWCNSTGTEISRKAIKIFANLSETRSDTLTKLANCENRNQQFAFFFSRKRNGRISLVKITSLLHKTPPMHRKLTGATQRVFFLRESFASDERVLLLTREFCSDALTSWARSNTARPTHINSTPKSPSFFLRRRNELEQRSTHRWVARCV